MTQHRETHVVAAKAAAEVAARVQGEVRVQFTVDVHGLGRNAAYTMAHAIADSVGGRVTPGLCESGSVWFTVSKGDDIGEIANVYVWEGGATIPEADDE